MHVNKNHAKDRVKSTRVRRVNFRPQVSAASRGVLPSKRLLGMCRCMGSHFHNWIDYNGVTFLVELLEWDRTFSVVSRDLKIGRFAVKNGSCCCFNIKSRLALNSVLEITS